MLDQLIINNVGSLDEYGASVALRTIKAPAKKEIKETVPFSNQAYDFSAINGEVYWEERELEFVLELTADTPEGLERKKSRLANWLMNVQAARIFDPHDLDHYFLGTYSDMTFEDDESVEYTVCTVVFKAYPYKIAVKPTTIVLTVLPEGPYTGVLHVDSGHRVVPTVTCSTAVTIEKAGVSYVFPAGAARSNNFKLNPGPNVLTISNDTGEEVTVTVSFFEEVF